MTGTWFARVALFNEQYNRTGCSSVSLIVDEKTRLGTIREDALASFGIYWGVEKWRLWTISRIDESIALLGVSHKKLVEHKYSEYVLIHKEEYPSENTEEIIQLLQTCFI